ncbi:MAG: hypothetical protein ABEI86_06970 [Halobacteriaceae archaeon]
MNLIDNRRAAAQQVGFLLILATIIILYSSWQATVIPKQNEGVEARHYQQVKLDIEEVRNTILELGGRNGGTGFGESVAVELGTTYPVRVLFVNPPPVSGSLRTIDPATGPDLILGGVLENKAPSICRSNTSKYFEYQPNYNEYDGRTIFYDNSVLYSYDEADTEDGIIDDPVFLSGQTFLIYLESTDTYVITIVRVTGTFSEQSTLPTGVDIQTDAWNSSTSKIRLGTNERATINYTSQLSVAIWNNSNSSDTGLLPRDDDLNYTISRNNEFINLTLEDADIRIHCGVVSLNE